MTESANVPSERERLEHRANVVRARMLSRLDSLDQRRHDLTEAVSNVSDNAKRLVPVAVGVAGVAGAVALAVHYSRKRRRAQRVQQFLALLLDPEAVQVEKKPSFVGEAVKKAGIALLLRVAQRVSERALERAMKPPMDAMSGV